MKPHLKIVSCEWSGQNNHIPVANQVAQSSYPQEMRFTRKLPTGIGHHIQAVHGKWDWKESDELLPRKRAPTAAETLSPRNKKRAPTAAETLSPRNKKRAPTAAETLSPRNKMSGSQ